MGASTIRVYSIALLVAMAFNYSPAAYATKL